MSWHPATTAKPAGQAQAGGPGGQLIAAEAAARTQAVAWVTGQVSRDDVVACDQAMCAALAAHGFPSGNLLVLGPTSPDPLGSAVIVATSDLRSEFGTKLSSVYAPGVIASFGAGSAQIQIRVNAADGAATYRVAVQKDLRARKAAGIRLLRNKNITVSAIARQQLAAGRVDSRLLSVIVLMAGHHRVDIVAFASWAPGAEPGTPLRFADLAESGRAVGQNRFVYERTILKFLNVQSTSWRPMSVATVRLASGQNVLQIEYSAPSPLNLLPGGQ